MYYDVEKIKEELLPIQVIEYLGVPYERHGKNIFIYCPEHEERTGSVDRHIGNCVLNDTFQRAYYCFGCGASGDAFRLIAMLEHLDPKHDFRKILAIAYEACVAVLISFSHLVRPGSANKSKCSCRNRSRRRRYLI